MKEHSDDDIVLFQNHTQVFENASHLKYLVRKQKHDVAFITLVLNSSSLTITVLAIKQNDN